MRSRTPALLLGLTTCLVAVGCSTSTSDGKPLPVLTSETSSASEDVDPGDRELPYAGAPAVDNPLETDPYQQDPCKALTETQAQELNLNFPGELQDGALGNSCRFGGRTDARARVVVSSFGEYPYGLSAAYKANEDGKFAFFEVLSAIEGFPAVAWAEIDDRPNGGCRVEFGTSDEIAFDVAVLLAQEFVGVKDPCESAVLVAGEVLRTMKSTS
jgi:hypothetical protein